MARDLSEDEEETETSGSIDREPDRRCIQCNTKLSLYNPGPHCWQHTIGWPWRGPSARPRF
jgi:hypothetical protein